MHSRLNRIKTLERNRSFIIQMAERRTLANKRGEQTRWESYALDGGSSYREFKFKLPGATYGNKAMDGHWEDTGVLVHARVQDFEVDGKKMLFIEELQSDWHNAGQKYGYYGETEKVEKAKADKIIEDYYRAKKDVDFNESVA